VTDYLRFLPDIILGVGGTTVLLAGAWNDNKPGRDFARWLAFVFFLLAAAAVGVVAHGNTAPSSWAAWNEVSTAFSLVFIIIGAWVVLADPAPPAHAGEWYALLQFAVLGMLVLARSANLAAFFLGLEILSLALYVLIAFRYTARASLRGGAIYLVLASFGSAFLAFGLALVYAAFGTLEISSIAAQFNDGLSQSPMAKIGFGMMLVGVGFKLAVVPFHMWTPDVYEAAPSIISGIIASASKGAMIAALFSFAFLLTTQSDLVYVLAGLSVLGGNLLGLLEQRVKRILAYSSIAHVGYILIGFMAMQPGSAVQVLGLSVPQIIFFYVAGYSLAALGAFAVLAQLENGREITLRDLRGLLKRHPLAAWLLMVFVVSLAGIPPTIGFLGKLYLFLAAVNAGYVWLVLIGLIGSAIGVYYYARILAQLFMSTSAGLEIKVARDSLRDAVLTATAVATVIFGLLPTFVFSMM